MAPALHDGSIIESHAAAVAEVWRAFAALFSITLEENRKSFFLFELLFLTEWMFFVGPRLLSVLLPTISLLLSNNTTPTPTISTTATSITTQTTAQLLSFATTSPSAFKEAAGKLDINTRELLEHSIRRAMGGTGTGGVGGAGQAVKPQILLRSF
jgi:HEAT repeat-containing protein 5